jgi:GTPase SAR1 family protein
MICASIINSKSFDNIKSKWIPEVRHNCPYVPVMIVGTKIDLRDDSEIVQKVADTGNTLVTTSMGEKIAKEVGAVVYLETSARLLNVQHAFNEAIRIVMNANPNFHTKKCRVM